MEQIISTILRTTTNSVPTHWKYISYQNNTRLYMCTAFVSHDSASKCMNTKLLPKALQCFCYLKLMTLFSLRSREEQHNYWWLEILTVLSLSDYFTYWDQEEPHCYVLLIWIQEYNTLVSMKSLELNMQWHCWHESIINLLLYFCHFTLFAIPLLLLLLFTR